MEVEVDGGVKAQNLHLVLEAGADNVVVGSSIFGATDVGRAAAEVRAILDGTEVRPAASG